MNGLTKLDYNHPRVREYGRLWHPNGEVVAYYHGYYDRLIGLDQRHWGVPDYIAGWLDADGDMMIYLEEDDEA